MEKPLLLPIQNEAGGFPDQHYVDSESLFVRKKRVLYIEANMEYYAFRFYNVHLVKKLLLPDESRRSDAT